MDVLDRLWAKSTKTGSYGCYEWQGARSQGYGYIRLDGKNRRVHRIAYELLVGPIDPGLETDHLCRNRACWNPEHIELVTHGENMRRAVGWNNWNRLKTHCKHGHPYTPENTYVRRNGYRFCRVCAKQRDKERPSGWKRQRERSVL